MVTGSVISASVAAVVSAAAAAVVSAAAGAAVVSAGLLPPEHAVVATIAVAIVTANILFFIADTFLSFISQVPCVSCTHIYPYIFRYIFTFL